MSVIRVYGRTIFSCLLLCNVAFLIHCRTTGGGGNLQGLGADWTSFGGSDANNRHVTAGKINSTNVGQLRVKFKVGDKASASNPVVENKVIYWTDYAGTVHATDESGRELWRKRFPNVEITASVAIDGNALYFGDAKAVLRRLDKTTGNLVWEKDLESHPHGYIWVSPKIVDNILGIGVGADGSRSKNVSLDYDRVMKGLRGSVRGIDKNTGNELWKWDATGNMLDGIQTSDGNAVWSTCAIDRELGECYIGIGNAWLKNRANNLNRPVDDGGKFISRYNDGFVALNIRNGNIIWHHTNSPLDAWKGADGSIGKQADSDTGAAPNLFELDGVKVVGVADKAGMYTVVARVDGRIRGRNYSKGQVVWVKKIIHNNKSVLGGFISSAAYANGRLYMAGNDFIGASKMYCVDAADGREIWAVRNGGGFTIAAPVISGDLVFSGDASGEVKAYRTSNGSVAWTANLPNGRGSDFTISGGMLLSGTGFHFFDATGPVGLVVNEPPAGGLQAWALPQN